MLGNKGDDADHLCDKIARSETEIVIPPKGNRKIQHSYDEALYKERNLIERFFNMKKPASPALRLLAVIRKNGLSAIA